MSNLGNVSFAGFWIRFAAYIIDIITISILSAIIGFICLSIITSEAGMNFFVTSLEEDGIALGFVIFVMIGVIFPYIIVPLFYFIYYPASKYKGTFGKQILGLIIVDNDGNQISLGRSFLRFIGYIIASIILYLGLIMIGFTERKQGLHDMISSTVVIYKSSYVEPPVGSSNSVLKTDSDNPLDDLL